MSNQINNKFRAEIDNNNNNNLYLCVKSKIAVIQPLTGDTKYYLKIWEI